LSNKSNQVEKILDDSSEMEWQHNHDSNPNKKKRPNTNDYTNGNESPKYVIPLGNYSYIFYLFIDFIRKFEL